MPRYDVRCRTCGDTFEVTRSITRLDEPPSPAPRPPPRRPAPAPAPGGHDDTVRLLPAVGVMTGTPVGAPAASGGGCCGGGCCG